MTMSYSRTVSLGDGREVCYNAEYDGRCYSLRVTSPGAVVESVYAYDVARDREAAKRLCDLFAENTVFPISVFEVLEDLSVV